MWSYDRDGELEDVPPPHHHLGFFFGVDLDYLDISSGIFDLFYMYEPVREKTNNLGSDQV